MADEEVPRWWQEVQSAAVKAERQGGKIGAHTKVKDLRRQKRKREGYPLLRFFGFVLRRNFFVPKDIRNRPKG